ncbi:unnamed protein product, partial [marine sediment metagenome]
MSTKYVASSAEIVASTANRLIRIIDSENPEIVFSKLLRNYFVEIGFSTAYPNFGNLNIGSVHPFIILLFADVLGEAHDLNVFPSITIADSSQQESNLTLARDISYLVLTGADVQVLKNYRDRGKMFISDVGMTALETATADGGTIVGQQVIATDLHTFDFNIWSANKDITSLIFDMVDSFLTSEIGSLHNSGLDVQSKGGRRTGDVNLEFGKILYGA